MATISQQDAKKQAEQKALQNIAERGVPTVVSTTQKTPQWTTPYAPAPQVVNKPWTTPAAPAPQNVNRGWNTPAVAAPVVQANKPWNPAYGTPTSQSTANKPWTTPAASAPIVSPDKPWTTPYGQPPQLSAADKARIAAAQLPPKQALPIHKDKASAFDMGKETPATTWAARGMALNKLLGFL